jgi:hypothetical protein
MAKRRDGSTLDLFRDFEPPAVVDRYAPERVRSYKVAGRIAAAVAETLKTCGRPRSEIARAMSDYLGERVSEAMLNQYAAPSAEGHTIPAHRLVALAVVTDDGSRLANALLADTGLIAVDGKYEALINRELADEAIEKLQRRRNAADAQWRSGR